MEGERGELRLVSHLSDPVDDDLSRIERTVLEATQAAQLRSIRWDHSRVGLGVRLAGGLVASRGIDVGYDIVYGANRLTALTKLSHERPDVVVNALELLFEPAQPLPRPTYHAWDRFRSSPVDGMRRVLAMSGLVASAAPLRRLLIRFLARRGSRQAEPALLMAELTKLRVIHDGRLGLLQGFPRLGAETSYDPETGTLTVKTSVGGSAAAGVSAVPPSARLKHLVWDNSSLGPELPFPRGKQKIVLPGDGLYEFEALTSLSMDFDSRVADVLVYALQSPH